MLRFQRDFGGSFRCAIRHRGDNGQLPHSTVCRGKPTNIGLLVTGVGGIIVAVRTLRYIREQTKATAKSAKAAENSVRLQEAAFKQWLIVSNWRNDRQVSKHAQPTELFIYCDIVNTSTFPFTYTGSDVQIGSTIRRSSEQHLLAPKEPYTITFMLQPTEREDAVFLESALTIIIRGTFHFEDALTRKQSQAFGGIISARRGGVVIFRPQSIFEESQSDKN
jgi:hypothetical protein